MPELRCGDVALDPRTSRVTLRGAPVKLTSHEFRVLSYLMHHRERAISQSELSEHIYAGDADRDSNTVEVFVARLRRKLGAGIDRNRPRLRLSNVRRAMNTSLRRRVFLGAVLWSAGLFVVAGGVMMVVINHHEGYATAVHHFFSHVPAVIVVSGVCLTIGLWYVTRGLSPVGQLRERLAAVHQGREPRLTGAYPAEIQPLVDDVNALLVHQEQTVKRAVAKAGDLAHGLKTPLALLAGEAERAAAAGQTELAAAITQHVERMRRQIDHHLAHARAAASGATPGRPHGRGRIRRGSRAHGATALCESRPAHRRRYRRSSTPFASRARISTRCSATWSTTPASGVSPACASPRQRADASISIDVEDDGSGLPEALREKVLQRGVRADEAAPGSGFGLAIVRDLAEIYGGRITSTSPRSAACARALQLPRAE